METKEVKNINKLTCPKEHDKIEDDREVICKDEINELQKSNIQSDRVFKRYLPNNKLRLYIINRDLVINDGKIDKLQGVIVVEPDYVQGKRVYAQIILTARLSREEEEVMGVKFCNEIPFCFTQLYPPYLSDGQPEPMTPLQEALIRSRGPNAYPFAVEVPPVAPPSIRLRPPQKYNGAPLGTTYEFKAWVAERPDEKHDDNSTVRMGITVIQRGLPASWPITNLYSSVPRVHKCDPLTIYTATDIPVPTATVRRRLLLSEGSIRLEARLDRAIYTQGDSISVHVYIANDSHRSIKRIEILAIQHVEVCMFNNGIFKNAVASEIEQEGCPLGPGSTLTKTYNLKPKEGSPKHWIALEETYSRAEPSLASTVICSEVSEKDRNPYYAINVSYYIQVKLLMSLICEKISVKLPFTLIHENTESTLMSFSSSVQSSKVQISSDDMKNGDDKAFKNEETRSTKHHHPIQDLNVLKNSHCTKKNT